MAESDRSTEFEALLDLLKSNRGFDFTGYKRPSLKRRIDKRLQVLQLDDYAEYARHLESNGDEFEQLFNTVLINVTAFFRDDVPWQVLSQEILPPLLAQRPPDSTVRVWSAGCASGEEAYTLAMVLAESLGLDQFRDRVKIYATDIDDEALARARLAAYTPDAIDGLPPALVDKYFERHDGKYQFRKDVRRSVIFGRNDLIQDAPISRVDLLACRNTLMYFNAATQERILTKFHFALTQNGVLLLGRAETLLAHSNLFTPIDLKRRLFSRAPRPDIRDRVLTLSGNSDDGAPRPATMTRLRDAAFDATGLAQIVVDRNGFVTMINERGRLLFGTAAADIGRPLQDLELSYRPVELRSLVDQAYTERRPTVVREAAWHPGDDRWFDITVTPLTEGSIVVGAMISFADVSAAKRLQREVEIANQELEAAYEELQSTNEELETTNEELQSTVEELETTNEELQSTNEELETMNEELQSTNEELQTINDELRRRGDELNSVNDFLESVFSSLRGGVVVVDTDYRVLVWNHLAEDMWGLRSDEVQGENFLGLDIGLPVAQLRPAIRAAFADGDGKKNGPVVVGARTRRGRDIQCQVTLAPLRANHSRDARGVIMLMEELPA